MKIEAVIIMFSKEDEKEAFIKIVWSLKLETRAWFHVTFKGKNWLHQLPVQAVIMIKERRVSGFLPSLRQ